MKVFAQLDDGTWRLVGRAEVPDDGLPVYELRLFGAAASLVDPFTIGTVTHLPEDRDRPVVERGILLDANQHPEWLPGWQSLAS